MHQQIFAVSSLVRYVARYHQGELTTQARSDLDQASSDESDRYEELLVNPTLLLLTQQRGNIDCGGLDYVVVRYGNFFQVVIPTDTGHVSVCIEPSGDPVALATEIKKVIENAEKGDKA